MAASSRPVFQKQGPETNCVLQGHRLGWKSCTAYAMAMGIDVATGGAVRPSGCKVRSLTGDVENGLTLSQVAEVAQAHYDVRVAVRTGRNAIAPAVAARLVRSGRGFVLQGNTGALPKDLQSGGPAAVNHAVWVNDVRGGTPDHPEAATVYDPAADGRRPGIRKGAVAWPWDTVLAFAAALRLDDHGRRLGPGRIYAGFIARRPADGDTPDAVPAPTPKLADGLVLRFGASRTTPFPDRTLADPPAGRKVNVRRRPDRLLPGDIVDLLPARSLFLAFQRTTAGAMPAGSGSRVWYGNRNGTEWIHESGLRGEGGDRGVGLDGDPLSPEPPADTDVDVDDVAEGADDLPDDVRDDDLTAGEPPVDGGPAVDTDVDAPVVGSPDEGGDPPAG